MSAGIPIPRRCPRSPPSAVPADLAVPVALADLVVPAALAVLADPVDLAVLADLAVPAALAALAVLADLVDLAVPAAARMPRPLTPTPAATCSAWRAIMPGSAATSTC